ncbi:hypothetical protein ACTXT7_001593 [Hymenolepis weldensis]
MITIGDTEAHILGNLNPLAILQIIGLVDREKSVLYPNQALPPPVYTNISKLQAAAQRGVVGVKKDASSSAAATGSSAASSNGTAKPRRAESPPMYDTHQSDWFGSLSAQIRQSVESRN